MKRGLIVIMAVMFLASIAFAADYLSVRKMYGDKNYDGVIKGAPTVIPTVKGKEQADLTNYLGNALVFTGQIDAGIAELKKIADIEGISQLSKDYAVINIAQALTKQKKFDAALLVIQPLLKSTADNSR